MFLIGQADGHIEDSMTSECLVFMLSHSTISYCYFLTHQKFTTLLMHPCRSIFLVIPPKTYSCWLIQFNLSFLVVLTLNSSTPLRMNSPIHSVAEICYKTLWVTVQNAHVPWISIHPSRGLLQCIAQIETVSFKYSRHAKHIPYPYAVTC